MSDERRDLPPVTAPNFLEKLREAVSTYLGNRGDKLDRGLVLRDLTEANIIKLRAGYLAGGGGKPVGGIGLAVSGEYEPDLTPPPTPTGFSASTSKTSIQVVTAPQIYRQGHGHSKTMVFGAKYTGTPLTFSNAVKLDEFSGDVHAFPVDPAAEYRLWVKWVTVDGQESTPAGGTNGVTAVAGLLDDANIAFLTATKIRSGVISVGEYIQASNYVSGFSGWRINGNGAAEFSGVTVRGTVYASAGTFTGRIEANSGYFKGEVNTGSFDSYNWPAGGAGGAHLSANGILVGNSSTGKYFQLTSDGNLYAPQFSIVNGAATFAGTLNAAGGNFSGTLTADAINAVNTINIGFDAVTIPVSADGGGYTLPSQNVQVYCISLGMGSAGGPIFITWATSTNAIYGVGTSLLRDGNQIATFKTQSACFKDQPGAGWHTYQVNAFISISGGTNVVGNNTSMMCLETKR